MIDDGSQLDIFVVEDKLDIRKMGTFAFGHDTMMTSTEYNISKVNGTKEFDRT